MERIVITKICTKCKTEKFISEFHKHSGQKSGLQPSCKTCICKFYRNSYATNPKARKKKLDRKKFLWKNDPQYKIDHRVRTKRYQLENRETLRILDRIYQKNRRDIDIEYKIITNLRARFLTAIKKGFKKGSAVRDLGCSVPEFKTYIESKFQPGMTWDNWTKTGWHMDHIRPLCSFDLSDREQLKQAVHYTNLQPLWASENLKKGSSQCP